MNKNKMLSLALLDLCTFAFTQVPENSRAEAEKSFEFAYRLAEKKSLPCLKEYRDFFDKFKNRS